MNLLWIFLIVLFTAIAVLWFMIMLMMRRLLRAGAKIAIERAWQKLTEEKTPTLKLIHADKILDEALRLLGYQGSLGDKLKKAGPRFSDLNGVWWAHKLRNRAVHDLTTAPTDDEINRALSHYHRALTDLGARP